MSASSIRDPLDRLVTRREAHAIAVMVFDQMLAAMQQTQAAESGKAEPAPDPEMGERVRAGG